MGTIEKICDSLGKMNEDKKNNLTARYQEHSNWLGNELALIRALIRKTPRDAAISSSSSSSTAIRNSSNNRNVSDDTFMRQKRKSSESSGSQAKLEDKQSPEQKRSSSENYLSLIGLPTDLSKLKKEQLLTELELRGNRSFSMKALKKDLIDALKYLLTKESLTCESVVETENQMTSTEQMIEDKVISNETTVKNVAAIKIDVDNADADSQHYDDAVINQESLMDAQNDSSIQSNIAIVTEPARKGSLMAEFRSLVRNTAIKPDETEETKNARFQNEFEARQRRHRDSLARKSQGTAELSDDASTKHSDSTTTISISSPEKKTSPMRDVTYEPSSTWMEVSSPTPIILNEELVRISPEKPLEQFDEIASVEVEEDDTSNEILRIDDGRDEESTDINDDSKDDSDGNGDGSGDDGDIELSLEEKAVEQSEQKFVIDSVVDATKVDFIEAVVESEVFTTDTSINDCCEAPINTDLLFTSSVQSHANKLQNDTLYTDEVEAIRMTKKPSNLLGGQSSFFDKAPSKSVVVPALEKARLAKAADEAKAAAKKKDLEKKKAAYLTAAANSSATTKPWDRVGKPAVTKLNASTSAVSKITTAIVPSSNVSSTIVSSVVPKKGITGYLAKTGIKTAALANNTTVFVAPPTVAGSARSEFSFDIDACVLSEVIPAHLVVPSVEVPSNTHEFNAVIDKENREAPSAATSLKVEAIEVSKSALFPVDSPSVLSKSLSPATPNTSVLANFASKQLTPSIAHTETHKHVLTDITNEQPSVPDDDQDSVSGDQYQIDDRESSSSSGSGTDEEAEQEKQKRIPEWARGQLLKDALERQYGLAGHIPMDPDSIFPEVQTCSLEDIFGSREGKSGHYSKRSSSAKWDNDELTLVEKRTYRSQMGYSTDNTAKATPRQ